MAIVLENTIVPNTTKHGSEEFEVLAGKSLRIETTPSGVEYLNALVPAGKKWAVEVTVQIVETDA